MSQPDDKYGETDARLNWIEAAVKKGMPAPSRDELAAFIDGFRAARATPSATRFSVREQIELVVEAGYDRDKVHPACYAGFSYSELFEAIAKRMQRQYVHGEIKP